MPSQIPSVMYSHSFTGISGTFSSSTAYSEILVYLCKFKSVKIKKKKLCDKYRYLITPTYLEVYRTGGFFYPKRSNKCPLLILPLPTTLYQ